jgi:hypothetical protein
MREKWLLWLAGVIISAAISTATFWYAFSLSGRISVEGQISGGSGSQPQVASPPLNRSTLLIRSRITLNQQPVVAHLKVAIRT